MVNQESKIDSDNTTKNSFNSRPNTKSKVASLIPPKRGNSKQGDRKPKNSKVPSISDIIYYNEIESKHTSKSKTNEKLESTNKQSNFEKNIEKFILKNETNFKEQKRLNTNEEIDSLNETKSYGDLPENCENSTKQRLRDIKGSNKEMELNSTYSEQPKLSIDINTEISSYNEKAEQVSNKNIMPFDKSSRGRTKFNIGKTGVNFNIITSTKNSAKDSFVENQLIKNSQAFNMLENNKQYKDFVKGVGENEKDSYKSNENSTTMKDSEFKFNHPFSNKTKF